MLQVVTAGSALALAGCIGGDDDDPEGADDEAPVGDDDADPDEDDPNLDAAPTGVQLDGDDISALIDAFDDEPFVGGQADEGNPNVPAHLSKFVSDDTFVFLHFDNPDVAQAESLLWMGVGTKGVFSEEGQPGPEFTHFHQYDSDSWEGGHGGEVGDQGYWLTHIAVDEFESPFGETSPGVDYDFMPTPAGSSDGDTEATFDVPTQGGLTNDDISALIEVFDDEPFQGGQAGDGYPNVPAHISKWVNEDVFVFCHFDAPDLREANDLIYYGIGVRGDFSAESQPNADDFTHFHKWHADSWEGGHGGEPGQHGYWLVHHAVRPLEMPWGDVEIGVDRNFMPTQPE